MTRVVFTGWRCGLNKVELDKALHNVAGLRLAEAIRVTEELLAGGTVVVRVENEGVAHELAAMAKSLGADCFVDEHTEFDGTGSIAEQVDEPQNTRDN
jgi:hypothetical protein